MTETQHNAETGSEKMPQAAQKFIKDETRQGGSIGGAVYLRYVRAMQGLYLFGLPILTITITANVFPTAFKWMIGLWVEECPTGGCISRFALEDYVRNVFSHASDIRIIQILCVFILSGIILRAFSWFFFQLFLANGGRRLHNDMAASLGRVRISFFDENPTGRLVRRFSGDYAQLMSQIPQYIGDVVGGVIEIIWVVTVIFFQVPLATLACVPCGFIYFRVQNLYRPTSRELQRLTKILENPIWSLFTETVGGYLTIRAYGRGPEFLQRLLSLQKIYSYGLLAQSRMTRWLNLRLKFTSEILSLSVIGVVAYKCSNGTMGVGSAGFLMSLTIGLDAAMQWLTRSISLLEASMVSVERVLEYRDLPPEETPTTALIGNRPADGKGSVEFRNFSMSYRPDLPVILTDFSMSVKAGTRVGIIGRTGAGKSSLFQSLFRMVERQGGEIFVDGVEIHQQPLAATRGLFGIIPQEPLLFSGTLRYNLDRTQRYSDAEIWEALKKVRMDVFVRTLPGGLEYLLAERGGNFSVGQRQLLCMARALLSDAKIILMDEATASVDAETDALIHASLIESFSGRTMLIIAHRLQTVQDCDSVAVLGHGKLIKMGRPKEILAEFLDKPDISPEDIESLLG